MNTISFILGIIFLSAVQVSCHAQTKNDSLKTIESTKKTSPNGDPLDLAVVTLKGSAVLTLMQNMIKQSPSITRRLTVKELDSINTLEKQPAILLEPIGYPTSIPLTTSLNGFVSGNFGMFTTPNLSFGYGGTTAGYALYGTGKYEQSNGHITNADFTTINASVKARYMAPEKYLLFGNSITETNIKYRNSAYALFANDSGLHRTSSQFMANVSVKGQSANIPFTGSVAVQLLNIKQDLLKTSNDDIAENGITGTLKVGGLWSDFNVGISSSVDLRNVKGNAVNFLDLKAYTHFIDSSLSIRIDAGFQAFHSSSNVTRGAFTVKAESDYFLSPNVTLYGLFFTGLSNTSLSNLLQSNPYVATNVTIDAARTAFKLLGGLQYHPLTSLHGRFEIEFGKLPQMPIFIQDSISSFLVTYIPVTQFQIHTDAWYDITDNDKLMVDFTFTNAVLDNEVKTPYITPLQVKGAYNKWWSNSLNTNIEAAYIGNRNTSTDTSTNLDGYFLLNLQGTYKLSERLIFNLRFDNLLNSSIFVWKGFRERGAFASLGLTWQF